MELEESDPGDVFAIPDLWKPSKFLADASEPTTFLFAELRLHDVDVKLPSLWEEKKREEGFWAVPDLSLGSPEEPETPESSLEPEQTMGKQEEEEINFDIWLFPDEVPIRSANYQSWDGFDSRRYVEPHTAYLTEAGPAVFDATILAEDDSLELRNGDYTVIDTKVFIASLLALGLGRSSVLFAWDDEKHEFILLLSKIRMSGYAGVSLSGLLSTFMECGNITRFLRDYVERVYTGKATPGRVALAESVSTLLTTIQSQLSPSGARQQSALQLQQLFKPAHSILSLFKRIVVNTSVTRSDESMLSTIFQEIELLEHRTDSLRDILLEILSRVSQPWLEFAGEWLGLQREAGLLLSKEGNGKSFVKVENKEWIDDAGMEMKEPDYILDYDKVPAFIAPDDARSMFEVGKSLRFLRAHHPDHPLAKRDVFASANPPTLKWTFNWEEIVQVEAKALQYEKDLKAALQKYSKTSLQPASLPTPEEPGTWVLNMDIFGKPEEEMQAHVLASISSFDQPLTDDAPQGRLTSGFRTYLSPLEATPEANSSVFAPPISLAPSFSFNPILAAQARIVNKATLRLFFQSHNLRAHLSIQHSFHLLANGIFSSRLSHALFDPSLESAERHPGVARSGLAMGLRLGERDSWPPASSELRLALMGVLSESYYSTLPHSSHQNRNDVLPGDLSFAVRDMSPAEIEACLNPSSLSALDFLRLSYKPPAPLDAVITPVILWKYDQLFKLLLRVLRLLYVISTLRRSSSASAIETRFRIESHHFVSCVAGYFMETGVSSTWRIFERKLDNIEKKLEDEDAELGQHEGFDALRDYHEKVVDRIMFSLFLRKRQKPVLGLLEEIFGCVLLFAKFSREQALGIQRDGEEVKELYLRFRKKVGVFLSVCRGLSEKRGYGERANMVEGRDAAREGGLFEGTDLREENTVVQLLGRLEMSGYYDRAVVV